MKKNYYEKGIRIFWLDEAESEYSVYDFDNYRYYRGSNDSSKIYILLNIPKRFMREWSKKDKRILLI